MKGAGDLMVLCMDVIQKHNQSIKDLSLTFVLLHDNGWLSILYCILPRIIDPKVQQNGALIRVATLEICMPLCMSRSKTYAEHDMM